MGRVYFCSVFLFVLAVNARPVFAIDDTATNQSAEYAAAGGIRVANVLDLLHAAVTG